MPKVEDGLHAYLSKRTLQFHMMSKDFKTIRVLQGDFVMVLVGLYQICTLLISETAF
jgi:hypothetical protein